MFVFRLNFKNLYNKAPQYETQLAAMASQNNGGSVRLGGITVQPSSSTQQQHTSGYVQSSIINAGTSNNTPQQPQPKSRSRHQFVKEGWGSRKNFQYSYRLGMGACSIHESCARSSLLTSMKIPTALKRATRSWKPWSRRRKPIELRRGLNSIKRVALVDR